MATSIAQTATLRSGAGIRPIPTVSRDVQASAAVADAMALSLKQSSQTHNSSRPASSTVTEIDRRRSGGSVGT